MSVIPQITCLNCGTKFSALRSHCPKCGAPRRHTPQSSPAAGAHSAGRNTAAGGAPAPGSGGAKWQLIFGGILIVAVIIAVIILITASLDPAERQTSVTTPEPADVSTPPPTTPPPTPTPEPTVGVTSVTIMTAYNNSKAPDSFTQRTNWAPIELRADVYPKEALENTEVVWRSSNEAVCTVETSTDNPAACSVRAVGSGSCEIIVQCGGLGASVKVLVP